MLKRIGFCLILFSGLALAQGVRYENHPSMKQRADGALVPTAATIAVCTQPANTGTTPCSPLATLYTDATLATPCSGTLKDGSVAGASNCSNPLVTDSKGNYHFYTAPNTAYTLQVSGSGLTTSFEPDITIPSVNNIKWVGGANGYTSLASCYAALSAGQTCMVVPNYIETLTSNLVLNKKNTTIQFTGSCIITELAFNIQVAQGADDVSIIAPYAHSSDQGGNAQGCTIDGYTGTGAAIDVGSSAGFTYNTLIRGLNINLFSAGIGAVGIRETNAVAGPLEYDEVVFGPVSGQVGFKFIGTGAFFDGTKNIIGPECNSSGSATNNICLQWTGVGQNGYAVLGGHANMGSGVNSSICFDIGANTSGVDPGGFDCDVAATGITIESTSNTGIRGFMRTDSGMTTLATVSAGATGNMVWTNTRSTASQLVTDNSGNSTNSFINGFDQQMNSRNYQLQYNSQFFRVVETNGNAIFVTQPNNSTRVSGSGANPLQLNFDSGTTGIQFCNGSGTCSFQIAPNGTPSPIAAAGVGLGTGALPFSALFVGTAATNNFKFQPAATGGARIITIADPTSPTTVGLPLTIGSGTAAMTTALIGAGACGTTVTVAATGVLTTDTIMVSRNAAATAANGGILTLNWWPTAGNVNFNYCNPTAAGVTPTAMTVNWAIAR